THFNFTGPDRVCILRLHQPEQYGDTIDRFTTLEAERTGQAVSGLELGPLGTFALRTVIPWRDGPRLLGYVELGHDFSHLTAQLRNRFGVESCTLVNKNFLVREGWETGMRMLNQPARWDQFEHWAAVLSTLNDVPAGIDPCLSEEESKCSGEALPIRLNGRQYWSTCLPLRDARGRNVGKFLIFQDVSPYYAQARDQILMAIGAGLLVIGILTAFSYFVLGRAESRMSAFYRRLVEESRSKEEAQRHYAEDRARAHRNLQTVIDAIADPFLVIDKDHGIVLCNQVVRQAAGGIDPVALGMKCHRVSHRRDTPCEGTEGPCPLTIVFETRQPARLTHTHFNADGSSHVIEIVASPVLNEKGDVIQVIESCRDITDRKHAEEKLQEANLRLEELATTDDLTGLWNRRWFIETLDREMLRRSRKGANLALVMLDIDHFKSANDTYGHAFGDRVLVETARILKAKARGTDVVARYAGDEFVILMPDTSLSEAITAIERIRQELAKHNASDGRNSVRVTFSAGIAAAEGPNAASTDILMRLADNALYEAKRTGRNRTCVSTSSCPAAAVRLS
ncbi:MAG: diguanylate cyclase, partial [Candidatus Hydrogenedentes bacterium]|nr:diguanylate cyclase [Candidatus Hydrogenedentota bacterium]